MADKNHCSMYEDIAVSMADKNHWYEDIAASMADKNHFSMYDDHGW